MSRFRNIELSDASFEFDHLRWVTFKSPALKARGDVTIFVPPVPVTLPKTPLVILLHGVYGSHWAWALKGGAHRTALDLIERNLIRPMVIAMPSDGLWGDGSGYVPHASADYERWIMEDVVGCVKEVVPVLGEASPLFLAGLSMGGFGALRLGAKYAQQVNGISAHSSLTDLRQLKHFVEEPLSAYGDISEEGNLRHWIKMNAEILPPLRFDCGKDDELIGANRQLHSELTAQNIPHRYFEFEGGHSWPYWQEHLADSLIFFEEICGSLGNRRRT